MKNKIFRNALALLTLTFVFWSSIYLFLPNRVIAVDIDALNSQIAESDRRIAELQKQKSQLQNDAIPYLQEAEELGRQIDSYQKKINVLNVKIKALQFQIDSLQKDIDTLELKIKEQKEEISKVQDKLNQRLRAMYMAGETSNINILLTADSMESFLTRVELIKNISENDMNLVKVMRTAIIEINKNQEKLKQNQADIVTQKTQIESDRAVELEAKGKLDSKKADLDKSLNIYKAKINSINASSAIIEKNRAMLYSQLRAFDASLSAKLSTGSGKVGSLLCPVDSRYNSYITCLFGVSTIGFSPHRGIDIGNPNRIQARILAAKEGTVVMAGYGANSYASYGNVVIIDHGDGVSTRYAHMSSVAVWEGQHVDAGQHLGNMGNTGGDSMGVHLHFEVLINNSPINPLPYLPPLPYRG